jgi:hypothetical protein
MKRIKKHKERSLWSLDKEDPGYANGFRFFIASEYLNLKRFSPCFFFYRTKEESIEEFKVMCER